MVSVGRTIQQVRVSVEKKSNKTALSMDKEWRGFFVPR
jgi:hypothetical protein